MSTLEQLTNSQIFPLFQAHEEYDSYKSRLIDLLRVEPNYVAMAFVNIFCS